MDDDITIHTVEKCDGYTVITYSYVAGDGTKFENETTTMVGDNLSQLSIDAAFAADRAARHAKVLWRAFQHTETAAEVPA